MHIASSKKPAGRGHALCAILEKVKLCGQREERCVSGTGEAEGCGFSGWRTFCRPRNGSCTPLPARHTHRTPLPRANPSAHCGVQSVMTRINAGASTCQAQRATWLVTKRGRCGRTWELLPARLSCKPKTALKTNVY